MVLSILVLRTYGRADIEDWGGRRYFPSLDIGRQHSPAFKRRPYPVVLRDVVLIVASYLLCTHSRTKEPHPPQQDQRSSQWHRVRQPLVERQPNQIDAMSEITLSTCLLFCVSEV